MIVSLGVIVLFLYRFHLLFFIYLLVYLFTCFRLFIYWCLVREILKKKIYFAPFPDSVADVQKTGLCSCFACVCSGVA